MGPAAHLGLQTDSVQLKWLDSQRLRHKLYYMELLWCYI